MISEKDVKHIAKLARLGLTEKEIKKFQKELSPILNYFEKLKEVDVTGIKSTGYSMKIENIMRKDEGSKFKDQSSKLLELAPETKNDYFKVKPVF
jgi:aspartyl-tRNA(Asn)/glutamyl-tRNA(Gln) amidotransferase subunit C